MVLAEEVVTGVEVTTGFEAVAGAKGMIGPRARWEAGIVERVRRVWTEWRVRANVAYGLTVGARVVESVADLGQGGASILSATVGAGVPMQLIERQRHIHETTGELDGVGR